MTDLFPVTLDEMISEVEREIAQRVKVYDRQVGKGRLKAETAERRLDIMRAVRRKLLEVKEAEA